VPVHLYAFPVEETIPRGAYVDPDELRELRGKVGLRSLIPSKVDIERPEFEAEAYRVFLFRELVMRENLRVTTVQVLLDPHKSFPKLDYQFSAKICSFLFQNKCFVIHFAGYVVNRFVRC
jgi:hypothetical protein